MAINEIEEFVTYRLEKTDEVYSAAQLLYNAGQWNSAVNRLYYACFYAASAMLIANHIRTKSHDGVKQMLSQHFVKTGKVSAELGKSYSLLFDKRTKGDYNDLFDNDEATCEEIYPKANSFVEHFTQMANDWLNEQEKKQ